MLGKSRLQHCCRSELAITPCGAYSGTEKHVPYPCLDVLLSFSSITLACGEDLNNPLGRRKPWKGLSSGPMDQGLLSQGEGSSIPGVAQEGTRSPHPQSCTCRGQKWVADGDTLGTRRGLSTSRKCWGHPANTTGQDAALLIWGLQGWVMWYW